MKTYNFSLLTLSGTLFPTLILSKTIGTNEASNLKIDHENIQNLQKITVQFLQKRRQKRSFANNKSRRSKRQISYQLTNEETFLIDQMIERRTQHWQNNFENIDQEFSLEQLTDQPDLLQEIMDLANGGKASSALSQSKSPLLQALNPYGCWCNFDLIPGPYIGEPVNEFDAACKTLHEGYRCIGIDNGQQCSDNAENYRIKPKYMRASSEEQLIDELNSYCEKKS